MDKHWLLNKEDLNTYEDKGCATIKYFYKDESDYYLAQAFVKFDGCINLQISGNSPFCDENGHPGGARRSREGDDNLHICDLDDLIIMLMYLKQAHEKLFPEAYEKRVRYITGIDVL